jgi:hypothetical protein
MQEGDKFKQPQERIEQLEREIVLLHAQIRELEARLARYENAHTPPSLRRGRNRKRDDDNKGTPGQNAHLLTLLSPPLLWDLAPCS